MAGGSFRAIFESKSKEEFSKNPLSLTGYLIEQRFPKEDISAYRTMARVCPAVVSKLLRGDASPEEAAAMASKQAKVDVRTARSLFERMCGSEDAEENRPETEPPAPEAPAPKAPAPEPPKPEAPRASKPRPAKAEPVPEGLVLNAEGFEATVLKYVGEDADIRIPSQYRGHKVTSIADNAFERCARLMTVEIPNTVEKIGKRAFSECKSLVSVNLPESVRSIGKGAFSDCQSLKKIEIPSQVESIENLMFYQCRSLVSIKLPASVKSIGRNVFSYCISLERVDVDAGNPNYTSIDGVVYDIDKKKIIRFPQNWKCKENGRFDAPKSLVEIGESAFSYCRHTTFKIPDTVT
ncbi:MAG: leucine-rich repeat domain-containing protein [Candidatus Methanomethylophilaceae archaeon]|nr:leucine-rich repeat domain-containing protein [Candidatus Methanomethylophilaceae archaeon]